MSKVYETGHAKNVANFEILMSFVIGYGTIYNPSKISINVGNMQGQLAKAKDAVNELHVLIASWSNAVAVREIGFEPLKRLGTRLLNALKATDTPLRVIENVATINRKLQGKRVSNKLTEEEKIALAGEGKVVHQISTSQLSYDSIMDHFDKLIKLLASIPLYIPI
jgi:D-arabinose 1-dehydrogenase-like Zn-dependent alcohol dehydrogenase